MTSYHKRLLRKKFFALLAIIIFHIIPVFISAYHDRAIHPDHHKVKLTELRYWLWFFTWWSAWTSLITVPWAVYKLWQMSFSKDKKISFWEQFIDLVITETNLVSGVVFFCGGFLLAIPTRPTAIYPLLGETKPIYVWIFYNIFWHLFAPSLVFYYFWKFCQAEKLEKKRTADLVINFFHPLFYLFYVLIRPEIKMFSYHNKMKDPHLLYSYPSNYPYPFFYWIKGEYFGKLEEKNKDNKWLFWHHSPKLLQSFFWFSMIVILAYLGFSFLFNYLVKIKNRQKKRLIKEKKMVLLI